MGHIDTGARAAGVGGHGALRAQAAQPAPQREMLGLTLIIPKNQTEGKGKVVAVGWGTEFNAAV